MKDSEGDSKCIVYLNREPEAVQTGRYIIPNATPELPAEIFCKLGRGPALTELKLSCARQLTRVVPRE